jgi:hypothetical protein
MNIWTTCLKITPYNTRFYSIWSSTSTSPIHLYGMVLRFKWGLFLHHTNNIISCDLVDKSQLSIRLYTYYTGMLHHVALVRVGVSEECSASIIRVARIGELGTMLAVTSNWRMLQRNTMWTVTANVVPSSQIVVTLMMEMLSSSKMSVLIRTTRHNIPGDSILHSHRCENLKSYKWCFCFSRN